ncbi:MAG: hypothetical protein WDN31_22535 [Hyphomicrobium sp.]
MREWLARTVNAPRDPAWTADGFVADRWMPVSPVSGALDVFQWRVPVETVEKSEGDVLASKIEELVALGVRRTDDDDLDEPPHRPAASEPEAPLATADKRADASVPPTGKPVRSAAARTMAEDATGSAAATSPQRSVPEARPADARPAEAGKPAPARRKPDAAPTRTFVPPHAPDDPGADAGEVEVDVPLRPQRA